MPATISSSLSSSTSNINTVIPSTSAVYNPTQLGANSGNYQQQMSYGYNPVVGAAPNYNAASSSNPTTYNQNYNYSQNTSTVNPNQSATSANQSSYSNQYSNYPSSYSVTSQQTPQSNVAPYSQGTVNAPVNSQIQPQSAPSNYYTGSTGNTSIANSGYAHNSYTGVQQPQMGSSDSTGIYSNSYQGYTGYYDNSNLDTTQSQTQYPAYESSQNDYGSTNTNKNIPTSYSNQYHQ